MRHARRSASTARLAVIPRPSKAVKTTYGLHTLPLLGGSDQAQLNRPMNEWLIEEPDFVRALLSDELATHWTTNTAARSATALSLAKPLLTIEGAWRADVPLKGWVEARFVLQPGDELTFPRPAHRRETDG